MLRAFVDIWQPETQHYVVPARLWKLPHPRDKRSNTISVSKLNCARLTSRLIPTPLATILHRASVSSPLLMRHQRLLLNTEERSNTISVSKLSSTEECSDHCFFSSVTCTNFNCSSVLKGQRIRVYHCHCIANHFYSFLSTG
jgi:hypothetical protein